MAKETPIRMVPVVFVWRDVRETDTGEVVKAMVPLPRYGNIAGRQFVEAEEYPLVVLEARTRASHNHYFAALGEAFQSIPEDLAEVKERLGIKSAMPPDGFVDAEHLRKWCLCEVGVCEVGEFDFETKEEAMRLARFYRRGDTYASIGVRGTHVTIKTAKSQSAAAMAKQEFEDSKRSVLDLLDAMLGLPRGSLKKESRR